MKTGNLAHTHKRLVTYRRQWASDVAHVLSQIKAGRMENIVKTPLFAQKGAQGASSDVIGASESRKG